MPPYLLRRSLAVVLGTLAFAALGGAQALAVGGDERSLTPLQRDAAPPGLDARLDEVADRAAKAGVTAALGAARAAGLEVSGEKLEVVVEADPGAEVAARAALTERRAVIERSYGSLIKAFVPVGAVAGLARAAGVRSVEPPQRAFATAVTGQGVSASNAAVAHADGDKGAGVKVGIIDLGFLDWDVLQAEGELPASVTMQSFCTDFEATEHGTAVAEIVHEVAPQAELHLICIEDVVDLGAAKDYAAANGITIVNLSVAFFNTGRGDGNGGPGTPEGVVRAGRNAGMLWVVAAGNQAESHWSGTFSGNDNGFHDFVSGDEGINFAVAAGDEACVFLKWDAWPTTSTQDFDLGIYDADTFDLVAASAEAQTVAASEPTEAACVTAPADAPAGGKEYLAAIYREAGTTPRLDLFVSGADFTQYNVPAGSIVEPASAAEALAVAAICWNGGGLEPYSSMGPTIDGRTKPDLAAFDSTSSASYAPFDATVGCGRSGFTGTSAAAPHVAGIAAILQQREGPLTVDQLRAQLESAAEDLGSGGLDNLYGWGRLRLQVAPQATTMTAQSVGRRVARLRGIVNGNRWPGAYRWEYSTDPSFATFSSTVSTPFAASATNASNSLRVDGLEPLTTYHARFVSENEHGASTGVRVTFTTADTAAPYVSASGATGVSTGGATLSGVVNPNGLTTTYRFSYGTSFPPATDAQESTLTGDSSQPVSAALTGLTAGRLYAYRLTATNSAGTTQVDGTFATTAAPAPAPAPAPVPAPGPPSSGGGGGPDLDVVIGHGPAVVAAGDAFTYTFVVRNKAAAKASAVLFIFTLPESLELLSTYAEKGSGCTLSGRASTCPLVFLDGSTSTRVQAVVRVRANGLVSTSASVSSQEGDANAADNQAVHTFTAGPPAPTGPAPPSGPVQVIQPAGLTKVGSPSADTIYGAGGPDTFRGLGGPDRLFGGGGNDRLFGNAGNDRLQGGAGRDLLDGGPGKDAIFARDGIVDTVRCGSGRDTVVADRKDKVARDCEAVRRR